MTLGTYSWMRYTISTINKLYHTLDDKYVECKEAGKKTSRSWWWIRIITVGLTEKMTFEVSRDFWKSPKVEVYNY